MNRFGDIRLRINVLTLKSGSKVIQSHRNRHGSIRHLRFPINVL